jgi:transcriptional regulator NrdR family protein
MMKRPPIHHCPTCKQRLYVLNVNPAYDGTEIYRTRYCKTCIPTIYIRTMEISEEYYENLHRPSRGA